MMKSEKWIRCRLAAIEVQMVDQVKAGMAKGWPVLYWDKNCVERALLRQLLGLRRKPFCGADMMAGW